mmetsp:Transcript_11944/g.27738  ORF Transcript_11944/g.27738 Transcript_11944/m.27738 type:complete len:309 (+) Transcript_11944:358-1284(+)
MLELLRRSANSSLLSTSVASSLVPIVLLLAMNLRSTAGTLKRSTSFLQASPKPCFSTFDLRHARIWLCACSFSSAQKIFCSLKQLFWRVGEIVASFASLSMILFWILAHSGERLRMLSWRHLFRRPPPGVTSEQYILMSVAQPPTPPGLARMSCDVALFCSRILPLHAALFTSSSLSTRHCKFSPPSDMLGATLALGHLPVALSLPRSGAQTIFVPGLNLMFLDSLICWFSRMVRQTVGTSSLSLFSLRHFMSARPGGTSPQYLATSGLHCLFMPGLSLTFSVIMVCVLNSFSLHSGERFFMFSKRHL